MAARKTAKKAAGKPRAKAKRPPAAKSGFGLIGWTAAAAIAIGWVASDGRASKLVHEWTAPHRPVVADRAAPRPEPRAASKSARPAEPVEVAVVPPAPSSNPRERTRIVHLPTPERTASIRPVPPRPAKPLLEASMPVPVTRPALRETPSPRAPVALPPAAAAGLPAAGERHATRSLTLRADPNGTSGVLGTIETGTLVRVERIAGDWRLVRSVRGGPAGWTDGRYLAGEGGAAPMAAPDIVAAREPRPIPMAPVGPGR